MHIGHLTAAGLGTGVHWQIGSASTRCLAEANHQVLPFVNNERIGDTQMKHCIRLKLKFLWL
jgi:hypothetical protein